MNIKYLLLFFLMSTCISLKAQTNITTYSTPPVYPQGDSALFAFLSNHSKTPKKVKKGGVVYVEVTIDTTGRIKDKNVLRSTDERLNQEALDAFKFLPDFYPAKKEGIPYEEKLIIPVKFIPH